MILIDPKKGENIEKAVAIKMLYILNHKRTHKQISQFSYIFEPIHTYKDTSQFHIVN